ncbi:olfactory receptor 12D2-like [Pelodytes ibericus]
MERWNGTLLTEFVLMGLTSLPWLERFIFALVLFFYVLNILGNLTIVLLVTRNSALHAPMYFFLANLSFLDIFYSSVTVPKMLFGFFTENTISIKGCITQLYLFHSLGCTEGVLLTAMGFDRYAAICLPLRYHLIMDKVTCIQLVIISWFLGFTYSIIHSVMTSQLPFCMSNKVRYLFCDVKPVIKLACTDIYVNQITLLVVTGFLTTGTFTLTGISYGYIIVNLMKIRSSDGRLKAFSTCSSHLIIVILFYGTAMCTYLGPSSEDSIEKDRVAAVLYTVITPALNPLIYTLRNKEVKLSFIKLFRRSNVPKGLYN